MCTKALLSFFIFLHSSIYLDGNCKIKYQKEFRVSYIFLSSKGSSLEEIDALRNKIINLYNDGTPFSELAKKHSIDFNPKTKGDLGWFLEGRMYPEFENAVKRHKKGDIFTVDIPSRNWYYVVLKTHEDRITGNGSE